jgi:predicted oxidoreductase
MVLATKAGIYPPTPYDCTPDMIVKTCEESLRRMNTDVIDVFYIHRPDMLTPHADVAEGLMRLVESGKAREIAVSNYTPSMFAALQSKLDRPLIANQVEFSPLRQDPVWDGTLDQCQQYDSTLVAWSPLGGGELMTQDASEDSTAGAVAAALDAVATRNGVDRGAAALAFTMISNSQIVPIIGTQRVERIAEANQALDVEMTRDEYYAIVVAWRGAGLP